MIIVIDLMRNIFMIMFFLLLVLEIVVFVIIIFIYKNPLNENQKIVEISSVNDTKEVLNSFNTILTRKIYNLETDLLLIAKHQYPFFLATTTYTGYPRLNVNSMFYQNLNQNCYNTTSLYSTNITNGLMIDKILKDLNNFNGLSEDQIIEKLFQKSELNFITECKNSTITVTKTDEQKKFVCYTVSIFKTLLIRNLIFEKQYPISNAYYLFINDQKYIYKYPLDNDSTPNKPVNLPSKTQKTFIDEIYKNSLVDSTILISPLFKKNNNTHIRGCINIPVKDLDNNFACIDININHILKDLKVADDNIIDLYLISKNKDDDFNVYYSNQNITNLNLIYFKTKYKLDDPEIPLLFNAIYFNIYNNLQIDINDDSYKNEYDSNIKTKLNKIIDQNFTNTTPFDGEDYKPVDFTINDQSTINIAKTYNKRYKDNFQYIITPVEIKYTEFDNTNYIFKKNISRKILFYSLAVVKIGSQNNQNELQTILTLKCLRNFFFFIILLLFANIVFYIISEIYVKFLISPIKDIRSNLEKLIKERNIQETQDNSEKEKTREIEENENKNLIDNKGSELNLYRNKETKKLEDLLNFLKKIITMKQAHGNTDFKVQSKIYTKFSGFLDSLKDKEHYRQCLLIIVYSKYKDKNFNDAYEKLEDLKKSTEAEEGELIKNDILEQKIINLPSQIRGNNQIQYLNEFTDYQISSDNDLNKLIKLRVFNQKILYFYGLIKFLDFYKRKQDLKEKNISKEERHEKLKEEYQLLEEAIVHLKKALQINYTLNFNPIKSIFILILVSKCYFYSEDYTEATNSLKEALIKFSDLNKYFFDKNLSDQIDPRVMFVTNGIIIEQILFYLARVCEKIGKRQLSGWIFNKLMEISYFRTNEIHRKSANKLNKFLFDQESTNFLEKKFLLDKICRRLRKTPANKKLCIVISENLLKNFNSSYEMREVLIKCIENYTNQFDLICYFQFDSDIQNFIPEAAKAYNLKAFAESPYFCKYSDRLNADNKTNFYKAMDYAVNILSGDDAFYVDRIEDTDKYIFNFIFSEDFRFASVEENRSLARRLIQHKISLYTFCLDETIAEKKILNIKKYLKDLVEGHLMIVKNFKIIKQAFQNISNKGTQKNILQSNFENHKFIL